MPDLTDLEALVRATRPAPDPAWAARLDSRAAAGFHKDPWWAVLRVDLLPALAVASVLTILVVAVVAWPGGRNHGLATNGSAGSSSGARVEDAGSSSASGGSTASRAAAPKSAVPAPAPVDGLANAAPGSRAVRQDAQLTLTTPVDNVGEVSDGALRVADSLDGYVQSSSTSASGGSAFASLELKVPSSRLDDALARLSRLAHVQARSQNAEDLTDQRSALRAAVSDARAERDGLRRRLARAATEKERTALRAQLQRAEHLIVVRQRRVAALDREVSYATIDVTVKGTHRHPAATGGGGWSPGGGLHTALRVLEISFAVLLVALAVCLPLGLVGAAAALAGRLVVRRRRERALNMA
jgi:Domain of unknown function (DUF4349)